MERALTDGSAASNKDNSSRMRMMMRKGENKIKRIENLSSRQVTFSKRRTGLLKKAYELSVLCDAQVAVIVFSSTGRLSEFANPNMPNILQKYQEIAGTKQESGQSFQNLEYWKHEAVLLKQQIEFFRMQESFLLGENLTCFQLKDLEILESKLCIAINKIREHKMECLQLHVQEIYKKENLLLQENNMLRHQIADVESKRERTSTTPELRSASSHTTCCAAAACTHQTFDVSLNLGLKP